MIYFDQKLDVVANLQRKAVRVTFSDTMPDSERITLSLSASEARILASELIRNSSVLDQHQATEIGEAMAAYQKYLASLITGIERWASDEDGIPAELHDDYRKAKELLGETYA